MRIFLILLLLVSGAPANSIIQGRIINWLVDKLVDSLSTKTINMFGQIIAYYCSTQQKLSLGWTGRKTSRLVDKLVDW